VCGDRLCVSESSWCAYFGEYWYAFWFIHKNSNFITIVILLYYYYSSENNRLARRQTDRCRWVLVVMHKRKENGKELDQSNIRLRWDQNSLRKKWMWTSVVSKTTVSSAQWFIKINVSCVINDRICVDQSQIRHRDRFHISIYMNTNLFNK